MHCPWVLFCKIMVLVLPSPAESSWQVLVSAGEYSSVLPEVHSGGGKTKTVQQIQACHSCGATTSSGPHPPNSLACGLGLILAELCILHSVGYLQVQWNLFIMDTFSGELRNG